MSFERFLHLGIASLYQLYFHGLQRFGYLPQRHVIPRPSIKRTNQDQTTLQSLS